MAETVAQISGSTNPGASNAEDFQPPTRNPQVAPGQLFPQSSDVQPLGQDNNQLLQNGSAHILVPNNPAQAIPQPTAAKKDYTLFIILVVLVALAAGAIVHHRRKRYQVEQPTTEADKVTQAEVASAETTEPEAVVTGVPAPVTAPVNKSKKKSAPKKSKSKRKKRARR